MNSTAPHDIEHALIKLFGYNNSDLVNERSLNLLGMEIIHWPLYRLEVVSPYVISFQL